VPVDPRLLEPPHPTAKAILAQMARRGLDPILVRALLPWLAARPLELALVAWDVLSTSLLPVDDPLIEQLRAAARPLSRVLPAPMKVGVNLNSFPASRLVAEFADMRASARLSGAELLATAYDHSLAAFAVLQKRGDPLLRKPEVVRSIHAFAKLLQVAHLPSLAAVYFDYLSRPLAQRWAALDLCETLFDAEAPETIPGNAIQRGDVPEEQLNDVAEYIVYRTWLALKNPTQAHSLLESNLKTRDPELGPPSARLVVVRAHLGTIFQERPVALADVEAAVAGQTLWRYGTAALVAVAAAQSPPASPRPLTLWHDYVSGFGNDFGCWYDATVASSESAPWRREACRVLGREARHLPHERAVWKPICMALGRTAEVQKAVLEMERKLVQQCTLG
jgi:hypothetical protein